MIPVILSDGTSIEVENESSENSFVIRTNTFEEIDPQTLYFTEDKINGATFEGRILTNKVYLDTKSFKDENIDNKIVTTFEFRDKSELEIIRDRLSDIDHKLPPLISPFTTNLEPTGVATRYYEKDELIAIYNNGLPITVIATIPISYKQPIIIDLNCELYLGGN